jgi:phosphoglycolate phosphatase
MRYDAVIFDIDGTLWDASAASAEGWTAGLAGAGVRRRITPEQIRSVTGNPYDKCVDILLPGFRAKHPALVEKLQDEEEAAIKARGGDFYDGAVTGIRELERDFKLFLVSNCQEWYLELFLRVSGLRDAFAGFDCHGRAGLSKDRMLAGLKSRYSLKAPVYVGDTAGDETAARLAGIEFVRVTWGFGGPAGESTTVSSFGELVEFLQGETT